MSENTGYFKHMIYCEAAYDGNIGFEEMCKFYNKASDAEIAELEKIIKAEDWKGFKKIIRKVLGVNLV